MELKLGSIPVRVHGWFILMALLLGANERDPVKLGIWVAIVVVSVVVHELGHAVMGKAFGLVPSIELHGMGGTTSFRAPLKDGEPSRTKLGTGKSIAISLAGPFAGFLFALSVVALELVGVHPNHPLAIHAVSLLFAVNIGWGIFNLLPMLPLDGGNVLKSILDRATKNNGEKAARIISMAVAAGIALLAIVREQWWVLYLGVLFAFRNFQALRQVGQMKVDQSLAEAIQKAYQSLDRNAPKEAIELLRPALGPDVSADLRQLGVRVYIVSMMKEGMWGEAMEVIERERRVISAEDLDHYARTMRDAGRGQDAERIEALGRAPSPLSEFRA
jgi:Zn-dependent protease